MMNKKNTTRVLALTLSLLCPALAAAGGARADGGASNPEFSRLCVGALAELAKSAGATPSSEGARLRIGKDELRLSASVSDRGRQGSLHMVGAEVDVSVNGVAQPLKAGVVGVGGDREGAVAEAAAQWVATVGVALLDALGAGGRLRPLPNAGSFSVHAGEAVVRGPQAGAWSDERRRQFLEALGPTIRGLESSPSEFHLILMMVGVEPGAAVEGECRVDGVVSGEALKAAKALSWPPSEGPYMVKQYYLLRRRPKGGVEKKAEGRGYSDAYRRQATA